MRLAPRTTTHLNRYVATSLDGEREIREKTLKQITKVLDQPGRTRRHAKVFGFALYAVAAVLIIGAFLLVSRGVLSGAWGVVVGAFGGISVGVASYLGRAMKQWPVVSVHIDRDSIKKRLNELET